MWIENRNSYRIRQVICAILGVCVSALLVNAIADRYEVSRERRLCNAQVKLADEVFRFHVLANSDSEEDQRLKLLVRDGILSYMEESMPETKDSSSEQQDTSGNENVQMVKRWTEGHLKEMEQVAGHIVREEGYAYSVNAQVLECYFPDRRYGDVVFPKGFYDALRVEIGESKGQNWWCVLYPSLCFVDATCAVVPDEGQKELKQVLGKDTYEEVTVTSSNFKIKSFFYELFKERTDRQMEDGQ